MTAPYDLGQRQAADRIERQHPAWVVLYGPWTRHFWAFPRFAAAPGTIIDARTTAELLPLMHATELADSTATPGPGWRAASPAHWPGLTG